MKRHVLLIEDDPNFSYLLKRQLEQHVPEWELVAAATLRDGVAVIETLPVHLIILDLALPDSDTEHTIQSITVLKKHSPVVILSGKDIRNSDAYAKCFAYGADEVWDKSSLHDDGKLFFIHSCHAAIARREIRHQRTDA